MIEVMLARSHLEINFKYGDTHFIAERGVMLDIDDKILRDVSQERAFWFNNGVAVRNIYEFVNELKQLNDFYFRYHHSASRDDFGSWIGGALGDIELAERLRNVYDKRLYIKIVQRRIKHLERLHGIHVAQHMISDAVGSWLAKHDVMMKVAVVFLLAVVVVMGYLQYDSIGKLNILNDKLKYVEQRDLCFNSYLDNKISAIETRNVTEQLTCATNYTFIINDDDLENLPSRLSADDIQVYNDRIIIDIRGASWSLFNSTSSMLPVINHNTKAIKITPSTPQEVDIGNIISYKEGDIIIAHRVVDKGRDDDGYYFITKGDNNRIVDPGKIRFEQIEGIVVALIY